MEQRNQFRIISAAAVLRSCRLLVVDWEAHRISRYSIVVFDSVPECRGHGDRGLAGLCGRANNRAGTPRPARRRAATTGFHSAERVLRNKQRRAVAAVFRRVVPLRLEMVANGRAELIAWSGHRRGYCVHVPDQIVELAADRHCGRSHPCKAWRNCSTKSSCRINRASSTSLVRRRPNLQLDGLAETAVWRCHRINGENRVPGLDAEAVR